MSENEVLSRARLAALIDHTFLRPDGDPADIERLCREAQRYGFATVMVNPAEIDRCRELLAADDAAPVRIGTTIGFPLGQSASAVKAYETEDALRRGARDLDMVLNLRALRAGDHEHVRRELDALARACRDAGATSKIILETCYLHDHHKREACRIAVDCGIDFVKTSTGFGAAGATVDDVRLMRAAVGAEAGVKAAGGIRDLAAARALLDAGADRLGCSASVAIVDALPA